MQENGLDGNIYIEKQARKIQSYINHEYKESEISNKKKKKSISEIKFGVDEQSKIRVERREVHVSSKRKDKLRKKK